MRKKHAWQGTRPRAHRRGTGARCPHPSCLERQTAGCTTMRNLSCRSNPRKTGARALATRSSPFCRAEAACPLLCSVLDDQAADSGCPGEGQQRRKEKMVLTEGHHPPLNQLVQLFDSSRGCPDHPWALHTAARPRPKARREGAAVKSGACGLVLTHGLRASGVSIRALSGKCFAARPRACSVSRHPRVSACSLAETDCNWCKRCECGGVLITLRTSVPCAVQSHCVCPSFPRVCAPFAPLIIRILY